MVAESEIWLFANCCYPIHARECCVCVGVGVMLPPNFPFFFAVPPLSDLIRAATALVIMFLVVSGSSLAYCLRHFLLLFFCVQNIAI